MKARDAARERVQRGGRARASRRSGAERQHIASLGGTARRHSLEVARRIADNLHYVAAVLELRGQPVLVRMRTFRGPLPGLYSERT